MNTVKGGGGGGAERLYKCVRRWRRRRGRWWGVVFGPAEAVNKHSDSQQDQWRQGCVCRDSLLPLETREEMCAAQTRNVEPLKLISQTCDFQFQTRDTNPTLNIHAESSRGSSPVPCCRGAVG